MTLGQTIAAHPRCMWPLGIRVRTENLVYRRGVRGRWYCEDHKDIRDALTEPIEIDLDDPATVGVLLSWLVGRWRVEPDCVEVHLDGDIVVYRAGSIGERVARALLAQWGAP